MVSLSDVKQADIIDASRYLDDISNINKVYFDILKVRKVAKIRNRYNQIPHLTQDPNGRVTI